MVVCKVEKLCVRVSRASSAGGSDWEWDGHEAMEDGPSTNDKVVGD